MPHPSRQPTPNACVTHNRISVHSGGTTEHSPPTSCHPRRATSRISTVRSVLRRTAPHPVFPSHANVQSAAMRPHPTEAVCAGWRGTDAVAKSVARRHSVNLGTKIRLPRKPLSVVSALTQALTAHDHEAVRSPVRRRRRQTQSSLVPVFCFGSRSFIYTHNSQRLVG